MPSFKFIFWQIWYAAARSTLNCRSTATDRNFSRTKLVGYQGRVYLQRVLPSEYIAVIDFETQRGNTNTFRGHSASELSHDEQIGTMDLERRLRSQSAYPVAGNDLVNERPVGARRLPNRFVYQAMGDLLMLHIWPVQIVVIRLSFHLLLLCSLF